MRELQESSAKLNKNPRRSPSKDGPQPPLSALPLLAPPQISITPSTKRTSPSSHLTHIKKESPIKMDSNGALNLASSPSPPAASSELTSTSDGARSPANHQRAMSFGVETCVVCGDRASGKSQFVRCTVTAKLPKTAHFVFERAKRATIVKHLQAV